MVPNLPYCKLQIYFCRNNKNKTALDLATENGHIDIVKVLFKAIHEISPEKLNEQVNPDNQFVPLIHLAIRGGHLAVVEYLLDNEFTKSKLCIPHPISNLSPIQLAVTLKHE